MLMDVRRQKAVPPRCPFCRREIDPPKEMDITLFYEFDGGRCSCGAHYAFDPTTRNGGAVLLQAMVQACDGDWDRALSLRPGIDFYEGVVTQYSALDHTVGNPEAFGTLYFVRLRPKK